ncbi:hypothetical protein Rhe02_44330 [Rhizocola hellebori]|uniref:Glycosyltransferase RgtA/B/C/D-like domain-containing protein n=1 Tax=Rhizocola hellebori TaxID=1392758 RepID=A0A8J3QB64_9ACTN|nr:hypothetical protein [Rhizocola hellebori]GIH06366.1 hypothetical protein Rhe02_44330 [Rhizocola hellebori]
MAVGLVALFAAYLRIASAMGVNADGASNALQAWDMWHGNPLLTGWTVTDVPFYTNELLLFVAAELVVGFHAGVVNVVAALVFTLLVFMVGVVAKGRATGAEAGWRVGLAVAVVGVPVLGLASSVQLTSPDHTGTAIPLLLTWLVLERAATKRWMPWAVLALLAFGQVSDPLAMYIGALPLMLVSIWRLRRGRSGRRGTDARLLIAGFGSIVLAQLVLLGIRLAGGFGAHAPPVRLAELSRLPEHLWIAAQALAGNFGAFFADRGGAPGAAMAVVHSVGLVLAMWTVGLVLSQALRRKGTEPGDRLGELLAVGVLVNLGAYVVSTLPGDLGTARQIVAVVPFSAVLVGRAWGARLAAAKARLAFAGRRSSPRGVGHLDDARPGLLRSGFGRFAAGQALAAVLMVALAGELAIQATTPARAPESQDVAQWLDAQGMSYGLGSYWQANNVTLITSGRVHVIPTTGNPISGYRWESRVQWYDPALHDARFLVLDKAHPGMGAEATAIAQFGRPVARHEFSRALVLVYDHNLLVGLPAYCIPGNAPSMAQCPPHKIPLVP